MVDLSRRGFLRGRSRPKAQIRPPWALPASDFADRCTRCNDCLRACPQGILVAGDGGYPTVDFSRGECTFCGDCVTACQTLALQQKTGMAAWQIRATIGEGCVARKSVECRICGEQCGESAIRFVPQAGGIAQPQLDASRCTGCGACVGPCPVAAITVA